MANTLTGLIPILHEAMDKVARELVGLIPSVARNSSAERAAVSETVRYAVVPAISGENITPGSAPADSGDATIGYGDMTISKARAFPVRINGEETKGLGNSGQYESIMRDRFAQAMRAACNEVEADIAALYAKFSRAYGTGGTTPFASSFADVAQVMKILDDNGTPRDRRVLVVDTAAALNLRSLSGFTSVSHAGSAEGLRNGTILPLYGFDIRESAQIKYHTKGAGTGYDIVAAGEAIGQTTLSLEGGTVNTTGIKAGDAVVIGSDTNKYLVTTGLTATSGDLVIAKPGLLVAGADADELVIQNSYRANMAFHGDAIQLVTRAPAIPMGGDSADDAYIITDPVTGLSFEVRAYRQYRQTKYEVCLAWGCDVVKPEFTAVLLG